MSFGTVEVPDLSPAALLADLAAAEKKIEAASLNNGKPMIGTSAGPLRGVHPADEQVVRSPCAQLKWLEDNTPFNYEAFVRLTYNSGFQGIIVTRKSDGSLVKRIQFPINGGDDADPYRQIPINHKRMVSRLIDHVLARSIVTPPAP